MGKLTLKELASYGLKIWDKGEQFIMVAKEVNTIIKYNHLLKPILKPLSDLKRKDIKNMKDVVNVDYSELKVLLKEINLQELSYEFFMRLVEKHFDVFGLINKGLAIDKNTL